MLIQEEVDAAKRSVEEYVDFYKGFLLDTLDVRSERTLITLHIADRIIQSESEHILEQAKVLADEDEDDFDLGKRP